MTTFGNPRYATFHLIEQPTDGVWWDGNLPAAMARIASTSKTITVPLVRAMSARVYVLPSVAGSRKSGAGVPGTVDAAVAAMALPLV
ncbi:MAG: hypothetical protein WAO08_26330 [Hyphomicrobiaceae bacterium]